MGSNYLEPQDEDALEKADRIVRSANAQIGLGDFLETVTTPPIGRSYLDDPTLPEETEPLTPDPDAESIAEDRTLVIAAVVFGAIPVLAILALLSRLLGDWVWIAVPVIAWLALFGVLWMPMFYRLRGPEPLDLGEHGIWRGRRKRRLLWWYMAVGTLGVLLWKVGLPYLWEHLGEVVGYWSGGEWS